MKILTWEKRDDIGDKDWSMYDEDDSLRLRVGNLIGSGIDQTEEGEITLVMIYESGSITQEIPADRVGGFRVVIREDTKPIPFTI